MTHQYIHITFSCAHSALVPVHLYEQSLRDDNINFTSVHLNERESLADLLLLLLNKTITSHAFHHGSCGRDGCYNISTRNLRRQILYRIDGIRGDLAELQGIYTMLGERYHAVPMSFRANYANHADCAMAHHQFALLIQPWKQDAFFEPWLNVASHCSDLHRRVLSPCFYNGAKNVNKVSKSLIPCHRSLHEIATLFSILRQGVETLEGAQRAQHSRILVRGLKKMPEDKEDPVLQVLKTAGVSRKKSLAALTEQGECAVVQCTSPSKVKQVRKSLKSLKVCGVSVEKFSPIAVQPIALPPIQRRFAVKDEVSLRRRALKNVLKAIWRERMSGFVSLRTARGQPGGLLR